MLFISHDLLIRVTFWYTCSCDERVWGSTRLPSHLSEAKSKTIMALSGPFQDRSESASSAVSQNRFNLALSPWPTQNCNPNVSSEKEKNAEIAFVWAVEQKSGERIYLKEYFHFSSHGKRWMGSSGILALGDYSFTPLDQSSYPLHWLQQPTLICSFKRRPHKNRILWRSDCWADRNGPKKTVTAWRFIWVRLSSSGARIEAVSKLFQDWFVSC